MSEVELLPCPFCGSKARHPKCKYGHKYAACSKHGCILHAPLHDEDATWYTTEAWNRRAPTLTAAPDTGAVITDAMRDLNKADARRYHFLREHSFGSIDNAKGSWRVEYWENRVCTVLGGFSLDAAIDSALDLLTPLPDTSAAPQGAGNGGEEKVPNWAKGGYAIACKQVADLADQLTALKASHAGLLKAYYEVATTGLGTHTNHDEILAAAKSL